MRYEQLEQHLRRGARSSGDLVALNFVVNFVIGFPVECIVKNLGHFLSGTSSMTSSISRLLVAWAPARVLLLCAKRLFVAAVVAGLRAAMSILGPLEMDASQPTSRSFAPTTFSAPRPECK